MERDNTKVLKYRRIGDSLFSREYDDGDFSNERLGEDGIVQNIQTQLSDVINASVTDIAITIEVETEATRDKRIKNIIEYEKMRHLDLNEGVS
jgi:hypothetical protein